MAEGRKTFQRQPARSVLLEFQAPMNSHTCLNIQQALSENLTFLHHLSGPCRLPYLSIFILGNYPECIYPLQPVKGNYSRVHAAMNELKSLASSLKVRQTSHGGSYRGCVLEGFQESLAQFQRFSQNFRQGPNTPSLPSQIELVLITSRPPSSVRGFIEQTVNHLDLRHLRKISAVCISDPTSTSLVLHSADSITTTSASASASGEQSTGGDYGLSGGQIEMSQQFGCASPSELSLGILDLHSIENDVLSLSSYFRGWFHDSGTDSEHLHLILPPATSEGVGREGGGLEANGSGPGDKSWQQLVLKCDLQERILDPALFGANLQQQMGLHVAPPPSHTPSSRGRGGGSSGSVAQSPTSAASSTLPLYTLRAISTLPAEGVCESILFGVPLVVRPTACWKLEWEELETNQQHFTALCKTLQDRDHVLLARSEHTSPYHAHFLLIPSSTPFTLLIRSVAVGEQLLPLELSSGTDEDHLHPTKSSMDTIGMALGQLEHRESYNPLQVQSGLHDALAPLSMAITRRGNLSRSSNSQAPQRRNYQPPPMQREFQDAGGSRGRGSRRGRGGAGRNLGTSRRKGLGFQT